MNELNSILCLVVRNAESVLFLFQHESTRLDREGTARRRTMTPEEPHGSLAEGRGLPAGTGSPHGLRLLPLRHVGGLPVRKTGGGGGDRGEWRRSCRSSGVLTKCVPREESKDILEEIHKGVCGNHASSCTLVSKAFRRAFYWPTALGDDEELVRRCQGCQYFTKQQHVPSYKLVTIPPTWPFACWGLDMIGPLPTAPGGPLSYGPPWAHYLGGYQDRLLGGPLGLPGLRYTAPEGVEHKDC
jgi:hypothetical protein